MGVWDHGSGEWSTSERGGFTHALGPAGTMVVARDSDWLHKGVYYPESHARARPRSVGRSVARFEGIGMTRQWI